MAKQSERRNGAVNRDTLGVWGVSLSLGFVHDMKIESGRTISRLM